MRIFISILLAFANVLSLSGCSAAEEQIEHGNVAFDASPRGNQVVFSSADGDLYLLNLKNLTVSRLTKTEIEESTPAFSPDGKFIVYAASSGKGSHIFLRSLDGKKVKQITTGKNASDSMPSYSSDGSQIVFARAHRYRPYSMGGWTWDEWDICVMNSDGAQVQRITRQKYYGASSPRFLRDGKNVVYSAEGGAGNLVTKLFIASATGAQAPKVLTPEKRKKVNSPNDFVSIASEPDISPDGKHLVFISDRAGAYAYDLYLMNVNGTKPVSLKITNVSTYNQNPVFTPDGKSVFFLAGTESNASSRPIFSLWRVDGSGKNARQVADSGLFTNPSKWKPKK